MVLRTALMQAITAPVLAPTIHIPVAPTLVGVQPVTLNIAPLVGQIPDGVLLKTVVTLKSMTKVSHCKAIYLFRTALLCFLISLCPKSAAQLSDDEIDYHRSCARRGERIIQDFQVGSVFIPAYLKQVVLPDVVIDGLDIKILIEQPYKGAKRPPIQRTERYVCFVWEQNKKDIVKLRLRDNELHKTFEPLSPGLELHGPFFTMDFAVPYSELSKPMTAIFTDKYGAQRTLEIQSLAKIDYEFTLASISDLLRLRVDPGTKMYKHLDLLMTADPSISNRATLSQSQNNVNINPAIMNKSSNRTEYTQSVQKVECDETITLPSNSRFQE